MIIGSGVTELFREINDAVEALAGDRIVCLAAHADPSAVPPGAIVYNQENVPLQVKPTMFAGHEVWDFSARNVGAWAHAGRAVWHVPVGYHPTMERFTMRPWEERDIDVVFTGVVNDRRAKILSALVDAGLHVAVIPPGIYGAARDEVLSRSKLSLAVMFYEEGVYGTLRAAHCAANKLPFISEQAPDMPSWASWHVPYDKLVGSILEFISVRATLEDMAELTCQAFKAQPLKLPEPGADFWARVRGEPGSADIDGMYNDRRCVPVSSTPRVHIAVPLYRESWRVGQTVMNAIDGIIDDLNDHGISADFTRIEGDSLICRMRQRVCHKFLMSGATHLLFCDGDIEPLDFTCARRMLESGHDVVAGAAPFKAVGGRVVCNPWPGSIEALEDGAQLELKHGCFEVMDVGTGFLMVSRTALLRMMGAHPELKHWSRSEGDEGAPLWALFDTGIADGTYQSEDYMFCRHWQALGGKVYVYVPATFRHWGDYGYEGSFCNQFGFVA